MSVTSSALNTPDILEVIFSQGSIKDISSWALVCKDWHSAASRVNVQKAIFENFPSYDLFFSKSSISLTYKEVSQLPISYKDKNLIIKAAQDDSQKFTNLMINDFEKFVKSAKYGCDYKYICSIPVGSKTATIEINFWYAKKSNLTFKQLGDCNQKTYKFIKNLSLEDTEDSTKGDILPPELNLTDKYLLGNAFYYYSKSTSDLSVLLPDTEKQMKEIVISHVNELREKKLNESLNGFVSTAVAVVSTVALFSFAT